MIQQGMHAATHGAALSLHSRTLRSFTEEPHVAVVGDSQGDILNLVHRDAVDAQQGIVGLLGKLPDTSQKKCGTWSCRAPSVERRRH